ncbi:MAG: hypothetical protein AB9834_19495 [Lentimicrobium sp.]
MKHNSLIFMFILAVHFAFAQIPATLPVELEMVQVLGGTFTMGSNAADASSNEKPTHSVTDSCGCPKPSESDIYRLCDAVTQMETQLDKNDIEYFIYEDILREISCIERNATKEEAAPKIREMWAKYGQCIECSVPKFGLGTDYILKYAVKMTFNAFLSSLVRTYKVNLSAKDPRDGKTIVEFCQEEITALEQKKPTPEKFIRDTKKSLEILMQGMKNP